MMTRILSVLVVVLGSVLAPGFSSVQAAEARIGDFDGFECITPSGEVLKPKFGDIDGTFFVDLPDQREQCLDAVDRRIAWCRENTVFTSNTLNNEHPACLSRFERQARACVAFFEDERSKCEGGSGAGNSASGTGQAADSLSPKCADLSGNYPATGDNHDYAQCWIELDNCPGCYSYSGHYHTGDSARGSGECRGGLLKRGTLSESGEWGTAKGPVTDGKRNGRSLVRLSGGEVWEGSYFEGKHNGRWVKQGADCYFIQFRNGETLNEGEC